MLVSLDLDLLCPPSADSAAVFPLALTTGSLADCAAPPESRRGGGTGRARRFPGEGAGNEPLKPAGSNESTPDYIIGELALPRSPLVDEFLAVAGMESWIPDEVEPTGPGLPVLR